MIHNAVITNLDGVELDEVPHKNLQFSYTLNAPGAAYFTMPVRHAKATRDLIEPGQRGLHIYRDGLKVWGGYMWTAQAQWDSDVGINFEGYFSRVRKRLIDSTLVFTQADQSEIAWALISAAQANGDHADLGIRRSPNDGLHNMKRDRTYHGYEHKPVGEAITQLAELENGFDFEINAERLWKTYYPRKGVVTDYRFELGKNIRGIDLALDATKVASQITVFGAGEAEQMKTAVASSASALAGFGLLQDTRSFKDVSIQETLNAHAAEELDAVDVVREQPSIQVYTDDPPFGSYTPGDFVKLEADHGFIQLHGTYRILSVVVALTNEGAEAVGVYFDEADESV